MLILFRKLNHQEVVEEDRRSKLPKNEEARKRKAEYIVKVRRYRLTYLRLARSVNEYKWKI